VPCTVQVSAPPLAVMCASSTSICLPSPCQTPPPLPSRPPPPLFAPVTPLFSYINRTSIWSPSLPPPLLSPLPSFPPLLPPLHPVPRPAPKSPPSPSACASRTSIWPREANSTALNSATVARGAAMPLYSPLTPSRDRVWGGGVGGWVWVWGKVCVGVFVGVWFGVEGFVEGWRGHG
jgi:hypothetical protein